MELVKKDFDTWLKSIDKDIGSFFITLNDTEKTKVVAALVQETQMTENRLEGLETTHPLWKLVNSLTGKNAKINGLIVSSIQNQQRLLLKVLDVALENQIISEGQIHNILEMVEGLIERTDNLQEHSEETYRIIGNVAIKSKARLEKLEKLNYENEKHIQDVLSTVDRLDQSNVDIGEGYLHDKNVLDQAYKQAITLYDELNTLGDAKADDLEKALGSMKKDWGKLKTNKYQIAVVGQIKVGKSTFMNALLGEEILGTGTLPETATLSLVHYEADKKAKAVFYSKEDYQILKERAQTNAPLGRIISKIEENVELKALVNDESLTKQVEISDLKIYTSARNNPPLASIVKNIEVGYPNKLCEKDIVLVDTPGLDDPNPARSEVTERYIDNADCTIMMYIAEQPFKESEKSFLKQRITKGQLQKLFLIVNKIDKIPYDEQDNIVDYVRENIEDTYKELEHNLVKSDAQRERGQHLARELKNIKIFKMDAKRALEGKVNNDGELIQRSYFDQFSRSLEDYVFKGEKNHRFFQAHLHRLTGYLDRGKKTCKKAVKLSQLEVSKLEEDYESLKKEKEKMDLARDEIVKQAKEDFEVLFGEVKQRMEDTRRGLMDKIELSVQGLIDNTKLRKLGSREFKQKVEEIICENLNNEISYQNDVLQKGLEARTTLLAEIIALKFKNLIEGFYIKSKGLELHIDIDDIAKDLPNVWGAIGKGALAGGVVGTINVVIGSFLLLNTGLLFFNVIPGLGTMVAAAICAAKVGSMKREIKQKIVNAAKPKIEETIGKILHEGLVTEQGEEVVSFHAIIHRVRDEILDNFDKAYEQSLSPLLTSLEKTLQIKNDKKERSREIEPQIKNMLIRFERTEADVKPLWNRYKTI